MDNKNFLAYYNQFNNKIYSYFYYRVNFNKKLAEDLTSEVFLKAFKNFSDFDGNKSFQSWIYAISRNHLINHYKQSKREAPFSEAENFLYYEDNSVVERYELEKVLAVINQMPETDKEILLLRYVQGLTNVEIADHLGMAEGAVRTQFSRSLEKLRKIIKNRN